MSKFWYKRKRLKTQLQRLNERVKFWCNKYVRLRDTVAKGWGYCCTCGTIVVDGDAGHFIGKGFGGKSGVRYDERNINLQCRSCNRFAEGKKLEYRKFMVKVYGEEVIEELELKHHINNYTMEDLIGLKIYYQEKCKELTP